MRLSYLLQKIVFSLGIISLFLTVTNFVNLSVLFFLNIFLVFFILMRSNMILNKLHVALYGLLLYFLLHTLVYSPSALLNYEFYRRDGNVFISFLPFLIYSGLYFEFSVEKLVRAFLGFVAIVNGVTLFLYLTHLYRPHPEYFMLFFAHNAAGGFLSIVSALALGLFWQSRKPMDLILFVSLLSGLYFTQSRGSLLGFVLACGLVIVLREKHIKKVLFGVFLLHVVLLFYTYPIWQRLGEKYPVEEGQMSLNSINRAHTFVDRGLFLWPRAFDLFLKSPILGTGFGSYNDVPHHLKGKEHILMLNQPEKYFFDDSHAHHSFLHVLAETGLLGFMLLSLFLLYLRRWILTVENSGIQMGLLLCFWSNFFSSCTEHRLFTPSQILPFALICGLVMANQNALRYKSDSKALLTDVTQ
ncbi:MAG: hypothetical protein K940chlam8_00221 [Chlamydiae bacterium]|nr:hypothetical protein [Chlamydiota bacterium]